MHPRHEIINAVNQLLIQIFDVFGAFPARINEKLRVLYETRNEKQLLLRHFQRDRATMPCPAGDMRGQERAGLPPKIFAGNKKSLFLDALKFRKAEKSPKNKKDQRHDFLAFVLRRL